MDICSLSREITEFNKLAGDLERGLSGLFAYGLSDSQRAFLVAAVRKRISKPVLVVTADSLDARKLVDDLSYFLGTGNVAMFPASSVIPYETAARSPEFTAQRLKVMESLVTGKQPVVVAPLQALTNRMMPPEIVKKFTIRFRVGESVPLEEAALKISFMGYERVDTVEGRGQFAVRGGILDVYPMTVENPYRLEFFGDEVDSIREFSVEDQRSMDKLQEVFIFPAREVVFDRETAKSAAISIARELEARKKAFELTGSAQIAAQLEEKIVEHIEKLENGQFFESAQLYISHFYSRLSSLTDYFASPPLVILVEPGKIVESTKTSAFEIEETYKGLLEKGQVLPSVSEMYFTPFDILENLRKAKTVYISMLPRIPGEFEIGGLYSFQFRSVTSFHGKVDLLAEETAHLKKKGYRIVILSGTGERGKHLSRALRERGLDAAFYGTLGEELLPGQVVITPGSLEKGFQIPEIKFALISDLDVYGQPKIKQKRPKVRTGGKKITAIEELSAGDYVVHISHGIGRYLGIETLEVEGQKKDYFAIQYAGGDKLYVPTDQVEMLHKYVSPEDRPPRLNKLGSGEWAKAKARVKESVKEMAKELLELYAARQTMKGFAFSPDTVWQKEFEDMFPYEETPDQLTVIEEVKRDMESDKCMDRLLCGDVGYGKTEVAMRAAFKAVMDAKQVAVLVPTTILAEQHYRTFSERFAPFPVRVEVISRFKSKAEQKAIIKDLKNGAIDIIIGTHRLLQKDVRFKDLGLLVIDEEQRFGVAHKEKIKQLKKNVDVLTLTATPIPRTLHMAMTGIRDMSVIETPPENRYPIQTYVVEYSDSLIRDAIMRELSRGGQVYYVYNRVNTIYEEAKRLSALVPEARIAVAHGQMHENELEEVMMDFYEHKYDVLVCTTIIETGLDIPNVNTLIVISADRFGLSQLYQLRGRVGRSSAQAFAYFTYRKDKTLSEAAEKRLAAIRDFTEFGAGFKIALRDLEIRGAGNILGAEQHGHMMVVGYDLYCKLLAEAVRELRGEPEKEEVQPVIDLKLSAYIPDDYIRNTAQKIDIYRRIAAVETLEEAGDLEEEIEDRFGDIPELTRNLLSIARLKVLAKKLKLSSIIQQNDLITFKFQSAYAMSPEQFFALSTAFQNRVNFLGTTVPAFTFKVRNMSGHKLFLRIQKLLEEMAEFLQLPSNE
ncbi:transcription-repair coupling factor [Thermosediminibacter litoriperuensis]|uniref:Transcription-repair-coupling factor n=1 Tax=Thermosediminibacter litoriperuensis TaxID=291989 RepID=A0A5S5AJ11_9FIRM|nr:transcription-repair coupling factor [Thermosediminibacter litoriperuensis]TYP50865.1 transcription-repair coupling factor [Thermosediminibacter litoriperuensis]